MMIQALIAKYGGIILAITISLVSVGGIGFGAWYYYTTTQERLEELSAENEKKDGQLERIRSELAQTKSNFAIAQRRQEQLQVEAREAEEYSKEIQQLLRNHDLTRLSYAKPGLIESRVNNATREIFNEIESITAIDDSP